MFGLVQIEGKSCQAFGRNHQRVTPLKNTPEAANVIHVRRFLLRRAFVPGILDSVKDADESAFRVEKHGNSGSLRTSGSFSSG